MTLTMASAADATAAINDNNFKTGVRNGISNVSGIPATNIMVVLTTSRRLEALKGRRLAGSVNVAYTITVSPAVAAANGGLSVGAYADSVSNKITTTTNTALLAKIQTSLTAAGAAVAVTGATKTDPVVAKPTMSEVSGSLGQPRCASFVRALVGTAAAAQLLAIWRAA